MKKLIPQMKIKGWTCQINCFAIFFPFDIIVTFFDRKLEKSFENVKIVILQILRTSAIIIKHCNFTLWSVAGASLGF